MTPTRVGAMPESRFQITPRTSPPVALTHVDTDPDGEVWWPDELPEMSPQPVAVPPVAAPAPEPMPHVEDAPHVADDTPQTLLPPVGTALSVDHVRVSENTYAFRLRWSNPPGVTPKRPAVYFQWVHRTVFELISSNKEEYGRFKQSIIAQFTDQQKAV